MKKIVCTWFVLVICSAVLFAENGILERLQQIPQVSDIKKWEVSPFLEYYEFRFEQPVDHTRPESGSFKQKVLLGHRAAEAPVIAELEGYAIGAVRENELAGLLKGNQLTIEHRFFDSSVPEDGIPWEYLTIKQAAADHHAVIQAIKQHLYPSSKWVSTGISKGGQTMVFHRYFYPDDVDVSVPYVAPLNLEYVDPRLDKFLNKLGVVKEGVGMFFGVGSVPEDCRYNIRDFQLLCFKHLDDLLPCLEKVAAERGYTYEKVGGMRKALELIILEYPFAFWQWGNSCEEIPDTEDAGDWQEVFDYLVKISSPDFFEDEYIKRMQPFFYAALTETGMYDYNVKPFRKFLKDKGNIDFSFTWPEGIVRKPFNTRQMEEINTWLQTKAERILFVYGGSDPWYATAVDLKKNDKCRKYVRGDMSHICRIKDIDPVSREDLIETLKEWLAVKP